MGDQLILGIDAGTTGVRAVLINRQGEMIARNYREFPQIYPQPGWLEHDPLVIWSTTLEVINGVLKETQVRPQDIAGIGITNQRTTTILWDKHTGQPVYNAIVWQDIRTAERCKELNQQGYIMVAPLQCSSKIEWILEHVADAKPRADKGKVIFGTVDSWLLWKLTGGAVHATEYSNASVSGLYDFVNNKWQPDMLELFGVPESILPTIRESSTIYGYTDPELWGAKIPIAGIAGDQQASTFGHGCFELGEFKNTYGTACMLDANAGTESVFPVHGAYPIVLWGLDGQIFYGFEGTTITAGATIQWLRDGLGIIDSVEQSEALAASVPDTGGVHLIPAFMGLGVPYWDSEARACILGITRGTTKAHIVRAGLEAIAFRTRDIVECMAEDMPAPPQVLKADGGAARNNFLMQFQADILGFPVQRPKYFEASVLGASFLAGLAVGYWSGLEEIRSLLKVDRVFEPQMAAEQREELYAQWKRAVAHAQGYGIRED